MVVRVVARSWALYGLSSATSSGAVEHAGGDPYMGLRSNPERFLRFLQWVGGILDPLFTAARIFTFLDSLDYIQDRNPAKPTQGLHSYKTQLQILRSGFPNIVEHLRLDRGDFGYRIKMRAIRTSLDSETPSQKRAARRRGEAKSKIRFQRRSLPSIFIARAEGPKFFVLSMRDDVLETNLWAAELKGRELGLIPEWKREMLDVIKPEHVKLKWTPELGPWIAEVKV